MTPPTTTLMSGRPRSRRWPISSGTRVLWPAARLEAPTTSTSFSTASRALSSGVWKSGPGTTSKPRSAKAEATRLAPRSWPSWPILATSMRGLRPSRRPIASTPASARAQRGSSFIGAAVNALHRLGHGAVAAERVLQRLADLAERRAGPRRLDRKREQVGVAFGALAQRVERGLGSLPRRGRRGPSRAARSGRRGPWHCRSRGCRDGASSSSR